MASDRSLKWTFQESSLTLVESQDMFFLCQMQTFSLSKLWNGIADLYFYQQLCSVVIEDVRKCITQVDSKNDVSHWLIHWVPTPDYSEFRISFASPYVQGQVIERFVSQEKENLVKLLRVRKLLSLLANNAGQF